MPIGLAEMTDRFPENSDGIDVWVEMPPIAKNSVISLEICWCGAIVKLVDVRVVPSGPSSVMITGTNPLFGLTSATPSVSDSCLLTSTGMVIVVVKTAGMTPTSIVSVALVITRFSNAVNTVAFVEDGVTME